MDKKRKKAYENLCYVHCATVQVVNFVFLATKCPRMIYRSPKKKYHKEQTLPKAQRTWELSAFARVLCPNRPETSYLFELWPKNKEGPNPEKFWSSYYDADITRRVEFVGAIIDQITYQFNLIWLCPQQGRHKFEFITMEKPQRLTTLCGDKVRVWLKKDCVTYLQVGASIGQIGWKRNNWSFFFSSCNWGQNNANDVIKISFRAAKHQKYLHSKSSFLPKILSFGQWGRL